jgi:hypothetical protein
LNYYSQNTTEFLSSKTSLSERPARRKFWLKCPVEISGPFGSPFEQCRTFSIRQNLRFGINSDSARSPVIHSFPLQWFTNNLLDLAFPREQLFEAFFIRIFFSTI